MTFKNASRLFIFNKLNFSFLINILILEIMEKVTDYKDLYRKS